MYYFMLQDFKVFIYYSHKMVIVGCYNLFSNNFVLEMAQLTHDFQKVLIYCYV